MNYSEIVKDLFDMPKDYVLAHCISRDATMGAGIARTFRYLYPQMPNAVLNQHPNVGEAILYEGKERKIFNLITKERYWHKPTREDFDKSIENLKEEMVKRNFKKLAIPQIGSGLDRLDWNENVVVIQQVFADTNIEIVVCIWK